MLINCFLNLELSAGIMLEILKVLSYIATMMLKILKVLYLSGLKVGNKIKMTVKQKVVPINFKNAYLLR